MTSEDEHSDSKKKYMHIFQSPTGAVRASITEKHVEAIDEIKDQRGISRAALLRQWCYIGWKMDKDIDLELESNSRQLQSTSDPYKEIFIEHLPNDPNDALTLEELKEEIISEVDRKAQKIYRNYEPIEFADDGGVYENEE